MNRPATLTTQQIQQLIQEAQVKKASGAVEHQDADYDRILSHLRYYAQLQLDLPSSTPSFTLPQSHTLRYQTQALKHLMNNEKVPEGLQRLVLGGEKVSKRDSVAQLVAKATLKEQPRTAISDPRLLLPSVVPSVVDMSLLKIDREQCLSNTIQGRIQELSSMELPTDPTLKVQSLIELKSLSILPRQTHLRTEIIRVLSQNSINVTASDRSLVKRNRKQVLREERQTEKDERALRGEKDKKERQKHLEYINMILAHGRDFIGTQRALQGRQQKYGMLVLRFHGNALKDEEKRLQRHGQDRLNALKANDEVAYMKLLDKTKDTRITTILDQTTSFLTKLTDAVEKQKQSVGSALGEDEDEVGGRDYYSTAHKITEIVHKQSSLLVGGTLKDYQVKGLQWMVSLYNNRLNGILADEMGLGKTIQTLSLITYLIETKKQPGPFLVIVPLSTMTNWVLEFEKWAPSVVKIVYKGSPLERKELGNLVKMGGFNVLLTTYEYVINPKDRPILSKVKWIHMIIDEGHRMKNANSKLSMTLMQFYSSRYRIILTGTPLQNNLPELWALLNFILPKVFNSVQSFDEWFNSPFNASSIQERIELNEEEQLLIIKRLHKVLRPFLLRRLKKDVESELPDKVEVVIKCPMSALQLRLTDQIKHRKFGLEGFAKKKALNNLVMQFRKVCNHPYVFDQVEDIMNPQRVTDRNLFRSAGKFELLDRILPKLEAKGHRVLMFFQMTQIMDIMEDYLRWKNLTFLRLDGNTKADDRTVMLKTFNGSVDPPFIFLLSTRAGGLGLNLQSADTVIIYDSDWNPHQDLQAQDRAHRIGQKKEVRILRLVTSKSVEETILARAQYKLDIDGKVIQAGKFDNKTSEREREELLRSLFEEDEEVEAEVEREGEIDDADLNDIIARNDEELHFYNEMDRVRRDEETSLYGHGYVRLMQDAELPDMFLIDTSKETVVVEEATGRGARARKEVAYGLEGIDDDYGLDDLDLINQKTEEEVEEEGDYIDKKRILTDSDNSDSDDVDVVRKKKKVQYTDDEITLKVALNELVERVEALEVEIVDDSETCEFFLELPSRKEYPEYFQVTKRPISIKEIRQRVDECLYSSLLECKKDWYTMFANAMAFNTEDSAIYEDALAMKEIVDRY